MRISHLHNMFQHSPRGTPTESEKSLADQRRTSVPWQSLYANDTLIRLDAPREGLTPDEVEAWLTQYGVHVLSRGFDPGVIRAQQKIG